MTDPTTRTVPARRYLIAWAVAGVALAASGVLRSVPLVAPIVGVGSVAAAIVAYRRGPLRAWANGLSLARLVALHALRLPIGCAFLVLYARGVLPEAFAVKGGIGDIAVGALAIVTAMATRRTRLVRAFTIVGLVDIVVVAATAMYLFLGVHDPLMTAALPSMPYALLPLVVVPVVIATHLLVLARISAGALAARRPDRAPPEPSPAARA